MPDSIGQLAEKGILGLLLAIALGVIVFLFNRLQKATEAKENEIRARVADAEKYASKLETAQDKTAGIAQNLGKIADASEAEREERERLTRENHFLREQRSTDSQGFRPGDIHPRKR